MAKHDPGRRLAEELEQDHSAPLGPEEKRIAEQMLGPDSIRFKLDRSGSRRLFRTLGAEARKSGAAPAGR